MIVFPRFLQNECLRVLQLQILHLFNCLLTQAERLLHEQNKPKSDKCSVTIYVPEISVKLQLKSWPKSSAGHFLAFSFPISAWYFQDSAYLQHLNEEKTSGLMNFQFIWATVFILWLECPHPQFIHLTHFDPKCWGSTQVPTSRHLNNVHHCILNRKSVTISITGSRVDLNS